MSSHILAIDDSRTIRTMLNTALDNAGFAVTTAIDGIDGVAKFNQGAIDLVITDMNMPRRDGFGVIEDIRTGSHNKAVPILVLTTESGAELRTRARDAGATGWIVKPFDETALISVVRRLTGG